MKISARLYHNRPGATLIEILVAIALTGIMMPVLIVALITARSGQPTTEQKIQANSLLNEAIEATRSVREASWQSVATNGTFHPIPSGTGWALASGAETVGNFTRSIVISSVERNNSDALVPSGGSVDPSTKLVTVDVSWSQPTASSVSSQFYLTHWQHETSWLQTTQADFNNNTLTNVVATATGGGQVQLVTGQSSGTMESMTLDATAIAGFNRIVFTISKPTQTTISLQIASNNDNSTWNYVGPDGTSATSFTASSTVPYSVVSGRYFRYKVTFTGTPTRTPIIRDFRLIYSKDT